jgi:diaminopropionate ammonia-lyase
MEMIRWIQNGQSEKRSNQKRAVSGFSKEEIEEVYLFHKSLPAYKATPLINLKQLAAHYGVEKIWLKDESKRFGLNAFKVLGASYAIGKYLSKQLNMNMRELSFPILISEKIKKKLGELTFVTATDGNHGRGVAWMAKNLQQNSVVYMPKGSAKMRFEAIANEGAQVTITDLNYDDAVRLANQKATENGWIIVQDTAWDGYEEIPLSIMQGYSTIINEITEQLIQSHEEKPTHIFLQAGVGSFAGAIQGYLTNLYGDDRPITIICEPHGANCIYESMKKKDGAPHTVVGDLTTIMAGLACGEPNTISWKILRDYADFSVSCADEVAARGMRILSNPLRDDSRVISGESGAVGLGLFTMLSEQKNCFDSYFSALNLNKQSRILCISTEGDTDTTGYRNIVWNGTYPNLTLR